MKNLSLTNKNELELQTITMIMNMGKKKNKIRLPYVTSDESATSTAYYNFYVRAGKPE